MALSDKQRRFVEEYLIDLNATQAAIRAGYSEKTARAISCKLLTKADIQAAINDAKLARAERTELTADWVLTKLREESTNNRKGSSHAARVRALELLGKHLDIFEERFRVVGGNANEPTPYEKRLAEFRKRYGEQDAEQIEPGEIGAAADADGHAGANSRDQSADPAPAEPAAS